MTDKIISRRNVLRLVLAGSAAVLATGCETLKSLPRAPAGSTDGSELAIRVKEALNNSPLTAQLNVDISSVEDEVIIKGMVPNERDRDNVDQIANQVDGVRHAIVDVVVSDR